MLSDRTGRLPERLAKSRRNPYDDIGREITNRIGTGRSLRLFTNDLTSPAEARRRPTIHVFRGTAKSWMLGLRRA